MEQRRTGIEKLITKVFCIFTFIFILLYASLSIDFKFGNIASDGRIQIYYSNSSEASAILEYYDTMSQAFSSDTSEIEFCQIPLMTDNLMVIIDGTYGISIRELSVKLGNLCLKKYDAEDLYDSISSYEDLSLSVVNEALNCSVTGENAFFRLQECRYFSNLYLVTCILIVLGISFVIATVWQHFETVWKNYFESRHKGSYVRASLNSCVDRLDELILFAAVPTAMFIIIELTSLNYWHIDREHRIVNCLILIIVYDVAYTCLARKKIAVVLCNIVVLIYAIANYYVIKFRGRPILPTDIRSAATALSVAKGYTFFLSRKMILAVLLTVILCLIYSREYRKIKFSIKLLLLNIGFLFLITTGVYTSNVYQGMQTSLWDSDILLFYRNYGMTAAFVKYQQAFKITKPQNYAQLISDNDLKRTLDMMGDEPAVGTQLVNDSSAENFSEDSQVSGIQPVNIIMIMNESFSDLKVFGEVFAELNITPFLDSLEENTIKGNLYVSTRGGGTSNTEFESLTGSTMAFLPFGVVPFELYIHNDTNSIASYLKNQGYDICALHMDRASNWNRRNVYPLLGISDYHFIEDYEGLETVRGIVTDEENYRKLIELYENKENDKFFIFNVTIQNHGGYDNADDLPLTVDLSQYGNYKDAEIFLSLIRKSDEAFEDLIEYFSAVDEPTMIIMYGDHQPTLSNETEEWMFSMDESEVNSAGNSKDTEEINQAAIMNNLSHYVTPFVIWTNYDIEEQYIDKISANYLPALILETANMKLPAYDNFLMYMYEKYPVVSTQGIIDANGSVYETYTDLADVAWDFDIYASLQYNNVLDKKCRQELFTVN